MSGPSTSTYPENLGSGGQLPTELRGRVSLFLYVCPSRYDARHRKPRRFVYALNLVGTGISPQDKSPPGKRPRTKAPPDKNPPGQKSPGQKTSGEKVPNGDIFYCSGSRQFNHSSLFFCLFFVRHATMLGTESLDALNLG